MTLVVDSYFFNSVFGVKRHLILISILLLHWFGAQVGELIRGITTFLFLYHSEDKLHITDLWSLNYKRRREQIRNIILKNSSQAFATKSHPSQSDAHVPLQPDTHPSHPSPSYAPSQDLSHEGANSGCER
jgi:hypothetical protein